MWFLVAFLIGALFGAAGAVLLILWYTIPHFERLFIFRPARDVIRKPSDLGVPYDQCFIDTSQGARLSAWHICPPNPVGSIIYFHGNGGNLGTLIEILATFFNSRLQVLAVDYRGYGWSTGSPTEQNLYEDAVATVRFFNANFKHQLIPLVYWGRSLGSCAAAYAAGKLPPSGLILETAFPDKSSLLEHYPHLKPFRYFSKYKFETAKHLVGHQFPVLLLHGDKDKTVPLKQGQLLYNQLTGPKEFWRVEGAGHIDIHMKDSAAYMRRVLQFVEQVQPVIVN